MPFSIAISRLEMPQEQVTLTSASHMGHAVVHEKCEEKGVARHRKRFKLKQLKQLPVS